jgi:ornithine cyclodeaminase
MLHITDRMVEAALTPAAVEGALAEAFRSFAAGQGGMQERVRTYGGGVRLSTMGRSVDQRRRRQGLHHDRRRLHLAIVLPRPRPARCWRRRRHAITGSAPPPARCLRPPLRGAMRRRSPSGLGVQGRAHAVQFAAAFPIGDILLVSQRNDPAIAAAVAAETGVATRLATTAEALAAADIIVTASRSKTPLFAGDAIRPGTFIAAVGSSLPTTRELDDAALARAARIAVEWRTQSLKEAGELLLAASGAVDPGRIVELGELVAGTAPGRTRMTRLRSKVGRRRARGCRHRRAGLSAHRRRLSAPTPPGASGRRCRRGARLAGPQARRRPR